MTRKTVTQGAERGNLVGRLRNLVSRKPSEEQRLDQEYEPPFVLGEVIEAAPPVEMGKFEEGCLQELEQEFAQIQGEVQTEKQKTGTYSFNLTEAVKEYELVKQYQLKEELNQIHAIMAERRAPKKGPLSSLIQQAESSQNRSLYYRDAFKETIHNAVLREIRELIGTNGQCIKYTPITLLRDAVKSSFPETNIMDYLRNNRDFASVLLEDSKTFLTEARERHYAKTTTQKS